MVFYFASRESYQSIDQGSPLFENVSPCRCPEIKIQNFLELYCHPRSIGLCFSVCQILKEFWTGPVLFISKSTNFHKSKHNAFDCFEFGWRKRLGGKKYSRREKPTICSSGGGMIHPWMSQRSMYFADFVALLCLASNLSESWNALLPC